MNIIIYVLDGLRADNLSCYGYERETSPHIDALAHEGVMFENCFTGSTWTRPAAASILTGTYPGVHLIRSRYDMFSTHLRRLPEVLQASCFKTAAFSTMGNVSSEIGFGQGFDQFYNLFREPDILAKRRRLDAAKEGLMHAPAQKIALPQAEDVHDYLFPWLQENRKSNTFSFIWSIETHAPYTVPEGFRRFSTSSAAFPNEGELDDIRSAGEADRQRLINLYDNTIYYNDHCLGQIVNYLKALDIYDETLFIVVGDHGDGFYEHGFYSHGHVPFEELIHVPLVMKFPGGQYAKQRVPGLVELIDIFPTVIVVAGLPPRTADSTFVQGRNLLPLLDGTHNQVREYVYSDTQSLEIVNRYLSVRNQRWKYIKIQQPKRNWRTLVGTVQHLIERRMILDILCHPRYFLRRYVGTPNEYLFDLEADPSEQCNLALERSELVSQFQRILADWEQQNKALADRVNRGPCGYRESETLRRHLEELGYL